MGSVDDVPPSLVREYGLDVQDPRGGRVEKVQSRILIAVKNLVHGNCTMRKRSQLLDSIALFSLQNCCTVILTYMPR